MRRHLIMALAGFGLLLTGSQAGAQYRPRIDYGFENQNAAAEARLIRRVMRDLDRAENQALPGTGDRWRIERARNELNQVHQQLSYSGYSSRRDIDQAIMTIQRVVDSNNLNPRMRDFLMDDMNRLRELRDRMGY